MKTLLLKMPDELWKRMNQVPGAILNRSQWIRMLIEEECTKYEDTNTQTCF